MAIIGIYKITNLINNKCYIGQSIDIEHRWQQHKYLSSYIKNNSTRALYLAFNKYGIENFSFEIIEKCEKSQLNEKEQYWIDFYDSYNNGYNCVNVFQEMDYDHPNEENKIPVLCYDLNGNFIKEYESISEASRNTDVHSYTISQCIKKIYSRGGNYQWLKKEEDLYPLQILPYQKKKQKGKKVAQYDENGNLLNIFDTKLEASKITGISRQAITRSCNGEIKFTQKGHYKWTELEEE